MLLCVPTRSCHRACMQRLVAGKPRPLDQSLRCLIAKHMLPS